MRRAVFLDRDGVLVGPAVSAGDRVFGPLTLEEFRLLPDIAAPLASLRQAGFLLVLATNQPGIARGTLTQQVLDEMHARLEAAVPLDAIFVCPHTSEDCCACRKPKPGLLLEAARSLGIDLSSSFFIGDTLADRGAAESAGVQFILLDAPYNRAIEAPLRAQTLRHAAQIVLRR